MDLLQEIREKLKGNQVLSTGLESVATHIEVAEKYHYRAKGDDDEHMFTDVIYRANHAFEGILKEAYEVFAKKNADEMTPYEIEEYFLTESILKERVVDLLTNYRKNWRNPSTHDYRLFFSEQESYLAIVNVSAFVSILIDQIIEHLAFNNKFSELENAAVLAREAMKDFDDQEPITKLYCVLCSYSSYYLKNFHDMIGKSRSTLNAEIMAFIKRVAPEFEVKNEPKVSSADNEITFDFIINVDGKDIPLEIHSPRPPFSEDDSAISQLTGKMRVAGLRNGIVYHFPRNKDDITIGTINSSSWPKDLNLREIYSDHSSRYEESNYETPVDLIINEQP